MLAATLALSDNVLSGPTWKAVIASRNNCVLKVKTGGMADQYVVTGTGVPVEFYALVVGQDPNQNGWTAAIESVQVAVSGVGEAQIYPLTGETALLQNFGRRFRFDSTALSGSAAGTSFTVTVTVRFRLTRPASPPPNVETTHADIALQVSAKAFNLATVTATSVNNLSSAPSGWQAMNDLPSRYRWASVSSDMATEARTKLAAANHALLEGDFHPYAEHAVSPAELNAILQNGQLTQAQKDAAVRELKLSKLLGKSTVHFCSSHGATGGFYAEPDPPGSEEQAVNPPVLVDWASVARTVGAEASAPWRPLMTRFVFLYSCLCGSSAAAVLNAYRINGRANAAAFAFNGSVFSTLKAGDTTAILPYNDANGNLLMTDKLTLQASALLERPASGDTPVTVLDDINNSFPPRKFGYGSAGVNYAPRLNLSRHGDAYARLRRIYRTSSESDLGFKQFGDWGLLEKELIPCEMEEENP